MALSDSKPNNMIKKTKISGNFDFKKLPAESIINNAKIRGNIVSLYDNLKFSINKMSPLAKLKK